MQLYRLLLTFSALVYAHPPLNPVAKSVAALVEGKEGLITSAVKAGTKRPHSVEPALAPLERIKFKPGTPFERVALICSAADCNDISFYIRRNFDDIEISLKELRKHGALSKEIMDKYNLDRSDALAIKRAFDRYNSGSSSGAFKGEPPSDHIRPEVLVSSLKQTGVKNAIKNEQEQLYSFYESLRRALGRVEQSSSFRKDSLDAMAFKEVQVLGELLELKYKSRRHFSDKQERTLQMLLDRNGYQSSRRKPVV